MKRFTRSSLLCLALVASACHASAPDTSLIGCWRAVRIVLHNQDGSKIEDASGRCVLQFMADKLESTCGTATGTAATTYEYRIARPNVYAATMTGSTFQTSLIGSTREYEYHVDGDRLVTVATSPTSSDAAPAAPPRVETEGARTQCR